MKLQDHRNRQGENEKIDDNVCYSSRHVESLLVDTILGVVDLKLGPDGGNGGALKRRHQGKGNTPCSCDGDGDIRNVSKAFNSEYSTIEQYHRGLCEGQGDIGQ